MQNPVRITEKYANLRKITLELHKICELTQNPVRVTQNIRTNANPVRITQNMRTYAKSRENYRKICELTQNPVRITLLSYENFLFADQNSSKFPKSKLFIPEIPPCAKISHISYRKKYPASCKSYRKLRFYAGNFRLPAAYVEPCENFRRSYTNDQFWPFQKQ